MRFFHTRVFLVVLVLGLLSHKVMAEPLAPKIQRVTLTPFTQLVVNIVPDLGTRFVFPFVLDEQDADVPFTLNMTNATVFQSHREKGRNFFVVTAPPPSDGGEVAQYFSQLFVSVAGFHITVTLSTTGDLEAQVSDVVFELGEQASDDLIQAAVAKRTAALEQAYREKERTLAMGQQEALLLQLADLPLHAPKRRRVKEERFYEMGSGDRLVLFVDEVKSYGDVHVLHYQLSNEARTSLKISETALYLGESGSEKRLLSASNVTGVLKPNEKQRAVLVTQQSRLFDGQSIALQVISDRGVAEVRW